ncbi:MULTISPECIES: imidazole glycerol phosphate synthase subunit HisH [Thalassospira]|uniref:Imidazole glycerol phosphate synthase subunit HisH n=2 Tax=Thalassospira tepidiphila TaxID=393657 RepID=A0A853L6G0_9PROT|nr:MULTISPECIES: imidazole glycerol phosphate synthase subunit HisH [Thalassospira]MBE72350.1 imidazole glycerol phosphate synthase subunit HisH [Thalassospira sp.]MBO6577949.1 imidazole glycerol phosphate synthase subunit HisH [Thalassospira sp.]MBO6817251.1 imidazole glycerol phosphate synthase subunit HisH [Thalassospira sp.]MBO6890007.1 imidazole glycerol phosphate synthase subunit HisH [Thalassospira sp.]NJB73904.1 glutamine amidotransferase [Thalassospira tepidiphila]|tara:strand:- start:4566 stop:5216 length:651 start_codon:yes stop_codon:yes gene_type:complete
MTELLIVNYDAGNIRSVERAVSVCGATPVLSSDPEAILNARLLILPGVGAFGKCISSLRGKKLDLPVLEYIKSGKPILGICVGMQMLMEGSCEFGYHKGLGLIPGEVRKIPDKGGDGYPHRVPHVTWEGLEPKKQAWEGTVLDGIVPGADCYFIHSYAAYPEREQDVLATCSYNGVELCAAVRKENLYGLQFHPEKSGPIGLKVISNFISLGDRSC